MRENKIRQVKRYLLSVLSLALCVAVTVCGSFPFCDVFAESHVMQTAEDASEYAVISARAEASYIDKHGNVILGYNGGPLTLDVLESAGYEYGDVVTVTIGDLRVDMPVCSSFAEVDHGLPVLVSDSGTTKFGVNMGDFAASYGIATKVEDSDKSFYWTINDDYTDPFAVSISMKEKGGYAEEYRIGMLVYTNEREDYSELTDEDFANFRAVTTTGIKPGVLYRTSSPIDDSCNRGTYADEAVKRAGVTMAMNLADSEDEVVTHDGYAGSYYSGISHIALSMSFDYTGYDFGSKLAQGLRYFAGSKGVYAVHCREGKARTGIVCALIECFMGASYDEVRDDYLKTYSNYYKIEEGSEKYDLIVNRIVDTELKRILGVEDPSKEDLAAAAEQYFRKIGLTDAELAALRDNLGSDAQPAASKAKNPLKVRSRTASLKYSKLKKKNRTLKASRVVKIVNKGEGKISYSITSAEKGKRSFKKHFKIDSKTVKLTVKKGLKKGTYKVRIKVSASGNGKYKAGSKAVTFKLKVR